MLIAGLGGGLVAAGPAHAEPTVDCVPIVPATINVAHARTIYRTGLELRVSRKVLVAALEAALTESRINNCADGDRDSVGVFQQRASWGSFQARTDVVRAATAFYREAIPRADSYVMAADLAQAVQRSAFPERYALQRSRALDLAESLARSYVASHDIADGVVYSSKLKPPRGGRFVVTDSDSVRNLQLALLARDPALRLPVTGTYGPRTVAAVRQYQARKGFTHEAKGVPGRSTIASLGLRWVADRG